MGNIEFWMRAFPEIEEAPPPWAGLRGRLSLPPDDAAEADGGAVGEEVLGHAEGQSFAIEYVDGRGGESVRRITVWAIREGPEGLLLIAKCHERKAQRTFRVDRIRAVIDYDGEVYQPPDGFLAEALGIDPALMHGGGGDTARAKKLLAHEIRLLAALGHADGAFDAREIDEILVYCDWRMGGEGILLDQAGLADLRAYIARTRPTGKMVGRALDHVQGHMDPDALKRFFMAAHAVVKADGEVRTGELAALEDLYLELTGLPLQLSAREED